MGALEELGANFGSHLTWATSRYLRDVDVADARTPVGDRRSAEQVRL
jgi:hypothetical protein